jgi:transcription-repair coupling factor
VVVPADADVEQYTDDIRFFLASMEGLSDAAAQQAVLPFPSHEVDPYRGLSPHLGVLSQRTRALHAAATGTARVIVASATALLPRLSPPDRLLRASTEIRTGTDVDPYALADLLFDAGFNREDPVDEHGEFCVRGGVIDVFPAGSAQPVRLDFVGDTVESIRHYDPASQRSTGEIERVVIVPLREVFGPESGSAGPVSPKLGQRRASEGGTTTAGSGQRAAGSEPEVASGKRQVDGGPVAGGKWQVAGGSQGQARASTPGTSTSGTFGTSSTSSTTREETEEPEQDLSWAWQGDDDYDEEEEAGERGPAVALDLEPPPPPPNYPALLEPGAQLSASLLDFVAQPVIFVCEAEEVWARAEKSLAQLASSHREMIGRGGNPPAPEKIFAPLEEVTALFDLGTRLDELEIGGSKPAAPKLAEGPESEGGRLDELEIAGSGQLAAGSESRPEPGASSLEPGRRVPPKLGGSGTGEGGRSTASTPGTPSTSIRCAPSISFHGRLSDWVADIKRAREAGETVLFVAATPGRAERTVEVLREYELIAVPVFVDPRHREGAQVQAEMAHAASVLVATGALSRGFHLPSAALQIFAETDVFEEERRPSERRRSAAKTFLSDFRDLKVGDHVVHVDHGIGVFVGLKQIKTDPYGPDTQEFLELRYAGEDKLFVPVERLDLLQKYTGATRPPLDRLGGTTWERAKTRVKKAMRDMAEELLKLYAQRRALAGHAFSPDTHWQEEFEGAFEYDLTPDQQTAVADIKSDMESSTPMDRLLCGDVGYGKTEVAMRAAFKAVMEGKQVAVLAPTTVLAFQHLKTLRERFAAFPVRIDMVSRFRSKAEIKQSLQDLAAGKVEVIVGTHRLLSKDVVFKDLGLLVVDEEQRFGVAHKERIKQMRRKVDVLTMTATPIPRTLNMSLVGIRDMSVIETPPKDRLAIQTNVVRFDQQLIARVVRNEIARSGQVYFVHNRVQSIYAIGDLLQRLVPEARVVVAHGQMGEDSLERAMVDFVAKKFDVLLATTIVENGLDIPNVNTIVINRADRYGLSQLYQLRGRVGRSDRPAYAYLLIPPGNTLSPVARKRLAAIREFSDLGSGFRVAALDLEIRGAGNLLGGEQSGHIEAIGFDMYMKLLEETVRELKGEEIEDETRATVNLGIDLRIDEKYVPEQNQRLSLYLRVAGSRTAEELERIVAEIEDRYGPMPAEVLNLVDYGRIRILADRLGIEKVDRQGSVVVFTFKGQGGPDPNRVIRLVQQRPEITLAPPSAIKLDLKRAAAPHHPGGSPERGPQGGPSRRTGPERAAPFEASRRTVGPAFPGTAGASRGKLLARGAAGAARSWWTARATEGEVKPGFSKEAIVRPVKDDPRAEGGVLGRVTEILSDLLGPG